jgi:glyoxylase-like metal-dependent hydrolase (beta-lactamase superfamily II)
MLDFAHNTGLSVKLILLTHTHDDHVSDLTRLKKATGAQAFVCHREEIEGAEPFAAGRAFQVGGLKIETRETSGHSAGGITYVIAGLAKPVAVAGDSIFAGSMGGGVVSYLDALANNRNQILTLPNETVLCPGHGPMTTVGEEKLHNPFFPEHQKN